MADAEAKSDKKAPEGAAEAKKKPPIKMIGIHTVRVVLHPEVSVGVLVNVGQSEEEAKLQAERFDRGESPVVLKTEAEAAEAAQEAAAAVFEAPAEEKPAKAEAAPEAPAAEEKKAKKEKKAK